MGTNIPRESVGTDAKAQRHPCIRISQKNRREQQRMPLAIYRSGTRNIYRHPKNLLYFVPYRAVRQQKIRQDISERRVSFAT